MLRISEPPPRVLADLGPHEGPVLIAIGGMHGNEPEGVEAIRRVTAAVQERQSQMRGRWVGLTGNRQALAQNRRYLDTDLNRGWDRDSLWTGGSNPSAALSEESERSELTDVLRRLRQSQPGRWTILDLHSTSSPGPPFSVMNDTPANRGLARALGLPAILGIAAILQGTLLGAAADDLVASLGIEGGAQGEADTIDMHVSILWAGLVHAGILDPDQVPDRADHRHRLNTHRHLPEFVEVCYRHGIGAEDQFKMVGGFHNFQAVQQSTVLAQDRHGEVRCPEDGILLLPLYQEMGDEGFFLGRSLPPGSPPTSEGWPC